MTYTKLTPDTITAEQLTELGWFRGRAVYDDPARAVRYIRIEPHGLGFHDEPENTPAHVTAYNLGRQHQWLEQYDREHPNQPKATDPWPDEIRNSYA